MRSPTCVRAARPGKAISYLLNHWQKLSLFLRQPGAPIDNNIVERALKKVILNRKNALLNVRPSMSRRPGWRSRAMN
jgi:hypothetical protein